MKHIQGVPESEAEAEDSIQGSYDRCDGEPAFIVADVTTDDAWLAISTGAEVDVEEWQ